MKKSFLLFTLLFILQSAMTAQYSIGIKSGYTNAWPDYGDAVLPTNAQTDVNGWHGSLIFYVSLSNHFAVGLEPGYIKRGSACMPGWFPLFQGDSRLNANYIEMPIMLSYQGSFANSRLGYYSSIGYGYAYALSGKISFINLETGDVFLEQDVDFDAEDNRISRIDHGFHAGLGLTYDIGLKHKILIGSSYYHGFYNFDKIDFAKNRSLNVSVGITHSL